MTEIKVTGVWIYCYKFINPMDKLEYKRFEQRISEIIGRFSNDWKLYSSDLGNEQRSFDEIIHSADKKFQFVQDPLLIGSLTINPEIVLRRSACKIFKVWIWRSLDWVVEILIHVMDDTRSISLREAVYSLRIIEDTEISRLLLLVCGQISPDGISWIFEKVDPNLGDNITAWVDNNRKDLWTLFNFRRHSTLYNASVVDSALVLQRARPHLLSTGEEQRSLGRTTIFVKNPREYKPETGNIVDIIPLLAREELFIKACARLYKNLWKINEDATLIEKRITKLIPKIESEVKRGISGAPKILDEIISIRTDYLNLEVAFNERRREYLSNLNYITNIVDQMSIMSEKELDMVTDSVLGQMKKTMSEAQLKTLFTTIENRLEYIEGLIGDLTSFLDTRVQIATFATQRAMEIIELLLAFNISFTIFYTAMNLNIIISFITSVFITGLLALLFKLMENLGVARPSLQMLSLHKKGRKKNIRP